MVIPEASNYHTWGDGKMVILAYTTIITVGGLLGNSLVIFLFSYYKSLRTVTNNFVVNLAACNLALALLDLSFSLPALFASDWVFGDIIAVLYAFCYFVLVSVSMVMLAIIAVDRHYVISRPKLRARISGTKSLLVILVAYIYTLAIASPILYAPAALEVKMYVSGCYTDFIPTSNFGTASYAFVVLLLLYVAPLTTMVYFYWRIYKILRDRRKNQLVNGRPREGATIRTKPSEGTTIRVDKDNKRVRPSSTYTTRNTPVKTLRVIVVLVILFLVTWTPYMITIIARAFNAKDIFNDKVKEIAILLSKSVVIINPTVYAFVNHRFQKCFAKLFCGAQVVIGATTCTENSIDFGFTRHSRGSTHECRRHTRHTRSRLSSTPDVFTSPEQFIPARKSGLRHSYSDGQLGKQACIEERTEETGEDYKSRNTDKDRFLKLGLNNQSGQRNGNWDIYVTSF